MTNALLTEELIDKVAVPFICMIGLKDGNSGRPIYHMYIHLNVFTYTCMYTCVCASLFKLSSAAPPCIKPSQCVT